MDEQKTVSQLSEEERAMLLPGYAYGLLVDYGCECPPADIRFGVQEWGPDDYQVQCFACHIVMRFSREKFEDWPVPPEVVTAVRGKLGLKEDEA